LYGIYGLPVKLVSGEEILIDDEYVRRSVLEPMGEVVAGFSPIMPAYAGRVSEEEILQLIAYIKAIGPSSGGGE
jgi:cytochrome c oxidase subunit 2